MNLYYEGTNITADVNITRCTHRDVSHGRADCLELEMDHAAAWYRWGPKTDDQIRITHNGYDTGVLYLNAVYPERDTFRILATSLPSAARRKAWGSFQNKSLQTIMHNCAAECGIDAKLYGIDTAFMYPFLLRRNEGCAAFLDRLGSWEGTVIKAFNGAFRGISIDFAQSLAASKSLRITTQQEGVTYTRRDNIKFTGITVATPYAQATARDTAAGGNNLPVLTQLPAFDVTQARRWARGILLMHNRKAEQLTISSSFDAAMTSLVRVDVSGDTDANGEWLIDEVEHDLFNGTSTAKMLRVLEIEE